MVNYASISDAQKFYKSYSYLSIWVKLKVTLIEQVSNSSHHVKKSSWVFKPSRKKRGWKSLIARKENPKQRNAQTDLGSYYRERVRAEQDSLGWTRRTIRKNPGLARVSFFLLFFCPWSVRLGLFRTKEGLAQSQEKKPFSYKHFLFAKLIWTKKVIYTGSKTSAVIKWYFLICEKYLIFLLSVWKVLFPFGMLLLLLWLSSL